MSNQINKWQPLIYALLLSLGITLGMILKPAGNIISIGGNEGKINELLKIIEQSYVDSVDVTDLEKETIAELRKVLEAEFQK